VFPRNLDFVLEVSDPASGVDARLFISLALLPATIMTGRQADHRIGYFATPFTALGIKDFTNDTTHITAGQVDRKLNLINRWRLEKDPACTAVLCEPIKPILFHVDPSVPAKWRSYVKIGIELWQPAFEAIGFKNTPRAVLPTDPDFPTDYHPGDIRYASISFSVSRDMTYSVGPSVADPRSGEILDADISFAHEWVAAFAGEVTYEEPRASYAKSAKSAASSSCAARPGASCNAPKSAPKSTQDERLAHAREVDGPLLRALFTGSNAQVMLNTDSNYAVVTLLLHCCYSVVILLLHCRYTVVTLCLHFCCTASCSGVGPSRGDWPWPSWCYSA
jgi:hypothetical protein